VPSADGVLLFNYFNSLKKINFSIISIKKYLKKDVSSAQSTEN
jgi:hypothetical protein